ncbi:DUF222 domain-containing protein [Arthrobacter stackebrandtii]
MALLPLGRHRTLEEVYYNFEKSVELHKFVIYNCGMGNSEEFPTDRDGASTTTAVADFIDALSFPVIEPLAADIQSLADLPPLPEPGVHAGGDSLQGGGAGCSSTERVKSAASQLDGVRALMDACGDAVAALRRHQNKSAALMAVMVERMEVTAVLEGGLLNLDSWQQGCSVDQICAELAVILHVAEGAARRFVGQSVELVRHLPETLEVMAGGELGWEHAVVIAEETSLLRSAGLPQEAIDAFERRLLVQAEKRTLGSFRSTARRMRERSHPETIVPRTKRAYADRNLRISRGEDGMSWMSLYAPAPTIEAIWDQCTYTAQAARGPHEKRTIAQQRADIAAALLLGLRLGESGVHAPAPAPAPGFDPVPAPAPDAEPGPDLAPDPGLAADDGSRTNASADAGADRSGSAGPAPVRPSSVEPGPASFPEAAANSAAGTQEPAEVHSSVSANDVHAANPAQPAASSTGQGSAAATSGMADSGRGEWVPAPEPDPCPDGAYPDPKRYGTAFYPWQLPLFDDPNYRDPSFREPDPRNEPDWHPTAQLPMLNAAQTFPMGASFGLADLSGTAASDGSGAAASAAQCGPMTAAGEPWPTLPQVLPVVLIPAISLLGGTNEPAWMEGVGPMSMEVAKHLASHAPSFLRVLVDPISNVPLDIAPERYRITQAMRTMLRIRDEYCQFPGCLAKAVNCDVDHIKRFETGGRTIYNNLENLCAHHHILKHFKDDKDRYGRPRCLAEPERQTLTLRGWTPTMEESGRISWTSPSGRYLPPEESEMLPPAYPEWLKKYIDDVVARQPGNKPAPMPDAMTPGGGGDQSGGGGGSVRGVAGVGLAGSSGQAAPLVQWVEEAAAQLAEMVGAEDGEWDAGNMPEPPVELTSDTEADEVLDQLAVEHALRHPYLGLAA